jgi:hypothetical protein
VNNKSLNIPICVCGGTLFAPPSNEVRTATSVSSPTHTCRSERGGGACAVNNYSAGERTCAGERQREYVSASAAAADRTSEKAAWQLGWQSLPRKNESEVLKGVGFSGDSFSLTTR